MKPRTFDELFGSVYLKADDLRGRAVTVKVHRVVVKQKKDHFSGRDVWRVQWYFASVQTGKVGEKFMELNLTQGRAIREIAGLKMDDDVQNLVGVVCVLAPDRAKNGNPTIAIRQAADHIPVGE